MYEHEWHRLEQAHVLANVQQAFSDTGAADVGSDEEEMYVATGDGLSPTAAASSAAAQSDAHALALMLQQQLDAINNEIRSVQEILYVYKNLSIYSNTPWNWTYLWWLPNVRNCALLS